MVSKTKLFVSLLAAALALPFTKTAAAAPVAGEASGVGTDFAVTDSLGRTYTIHSTDEVYYTATAVAAGTRAMINLFLESAGASTSTHLTIGGLVPDLDYHFYVGADYAYSILKADASGILGLAVDLQGPTAVTVKTWPSTYYIGVVVDGVLTNNCAAMGGTAPTGTFTCTLPAPSSIPFTQTVAVGTGWTLDGNGNTIDMGGTGTAVEIRSAAGVTIKNLTIKNATNGVLVHYSNPATPHPASTIQNTRIENCTYGVALVNSSEGNKLQSNTIEGNNTGIWIYSSHRNTFEQNILKNNSTGVDLRYYSNENIFRTNEFTSDPPNQSTAVNFFCSVEMMWGIPILVCPSLGNKFYNNIFNTPVNVSSTKTPPDNPAAIWNTTPPGEKEINIVGGANLGGNYWAAYVCPTEVNADGFCTTPYGIVTAENLSMGTDAYPLVPTNRSPVLTITPPGPVSVREGANLTPITVTGTDQDNDSLTLNLANMPTDAVFTGTLANFSTGTLTWTSDIQSQDRQYGVEFTLRDDGYPPREVSKTLRIDVKANQAPTLTPYTYSHVVQEGGTLVFAVAITDPEDDDINDGTLSGTCLRDIVPCDVIWPSPFPVGASFSKQTGVTQYDFRWETQSGQAGTYDIILSAEDTGLDPRLGSSQIITIEVQEPSTVTLAITAPDPVSVEATGPATVVAIGTATATGGVGDVAITNNAPVDGFPVGTTTVTWTATDTANNSATATQDVTVTDTTPPSFLGVPTSPIIAEATSAAGAVVTFDNPTATDLVDGPVSVSCSPASGNTFALGETPVTCTATDAKNNSATASFKVTVEDKTAPVISALSISPPNASSASGAVVTYDTPTAFDLVDGPVTVSCSPASGSMFLPGTTTVTCGAEDKRIPPNKASKSANVTVKYKWTGFFSPVNNPGPDNNVINTAKAGSAIPVKFSLDGDMGLDIFAVGFPKVAGFILNEGTAVYDEIEVTVETAGGSSLSYDPVKNQYVYVWKTARAWAGRNYELRVLLKDGSLKKAFFSFR